MSKFVFTSSLNAAARAALAKGDGKHDGFAVDGNYIAVLDETGRAMDWIKVIKQDGPPIIEQF